MPGWKIYYLTAQPSTGTNIYGTVKHKNLFHGLRDITSNPLQNQWLKIFS